MVTRFWLAATPALFVLLWSTGFIGAKYGLPATEPFTFLALRLLIAAGMLALLAWLMGASWPRGPRLIIHITVAGLLVHAGYLGGVFYAIHLGMAAGVVSIIVAVQPLLTAALAGWLLGEQVGLRQWLGLALGALGVMLVVWNRLDGAGSWGAFVAALVALLSITGGTLYQKRFCPDSDIRTAGTIQYLGAGLLLLLQAVGFESMRIEWSGEFLFALAWLVLALSVGAVGLLFVLIRHGAASRVASLFYLAPPVTVLLGYLLFDETLSPAALAGLMVVMIGVLLVNLPQARSAAAAPIAEGCVGSARH
ncbi:MAG: DMT family transporter [Xanthomonadaceae bacterium]|nr:DMT family transporter [Xanthomonadaceae bacterium]